MLDWFLVPLSDKHTRQHFVDPTDLLIDRLDGVEPEEDERPIDVHRLMAAIERLPAREYDLYVEHRLKGARQEDLARIFGVTQAAVSYRIKRAEERIRYFMTEPDFTEDEMRATLVKVVRDPLTREVMVTMWRRATTTYAALDLGITQGSARYWFLKGLRILEAAAKQDPSIEPYHRLFHLLDTHKKIKEEVVLPQWSEAGRRSRSARMA